MCWRKVRWRQKLVFECLQVLLQSKDTIEKGNENVIFRFLLFLLLLIIVMAATATNPLKQDNKKHQTFSFFFPSTLRLFQVTPSQLFLLRLVSCLELLVTPEGYHSINLISVKCWLTYTKLIHLLFAYFKSLRRILSSSTSITSSSACLASVFFDWVCFLWA